MLERLTNQEANFANHYYHLIHAFLKQHKLVESEYYDVVVFGFLEAVQIYLRRPDDQSSFEKLAEQEMYKSYTVHLQEACSDQAAFDIDNSVQRIAEQMEAERQFERCMWAIEDYAYLMELLKDQERETVRLLFEGHTTKEAATLLGLNDQKMSCILKRIQMAAHTAA